jgi:uncharacterized protein YprB with RNaseH-like and TPR domain
MFSSRPTTILDVIDLHCVLFIDIETVPAYPDFDALPPEWQELWREKARRYSNENIPAEDLYFLKAGIHAEFGKIVCVSVGAYPRDRKNGPAFRTRSFYGADEKQLLLDFKSMLDSHFNDCGKHFLCAHNGIEFDYPFLSRRMIMQNIQLPALLKVSGSKSWNNKWLLDTMELWRFGDYKEKTSLKLLAACLGIQSPKDDISGADVAHVFYHENDIERIATYCQKDVFTLAGIFRIFAGLAPAEENDVIL